MCGEGKKRCEGRENGDKVIDTGSRQEEGMKPSRLGCWVFGEGG